jgi:ATP-dependent Clp protease ATP-binding subunit ClpC
MIRFDKLTFRAREAFQRAAEIVERYGHNQIDTEHLLLALIEQFRSPVPKLLGMLQVNGDELIDRVVFSLKASPRMVVTGGMTDRFNMTVRVRQVVDQEGSEADQLGDVAVSPEHLLLAIFTGQSSPALQLLEAYGLSRNGVLDALLQYRARDAAEDALSWDDEL